MSDSLTYTYQHTCKKGHPAHILQKTPFKSSVKKAQDGKIYIPFLGEGHYLWEENIEAAERWGAKRYPKNYNIVEYLDLEIPKVDLLDFLDRRNSQYFRELRQTYINRRPELKNWKLGNWIELFKSLNKKEPGIFPYNFIRADENLPEVDKNANIKEKVKFADGLDYFTYLSPLIIICIIDKTKITSKSKLIKV